MNASDLERPRAICNVRPMRLPLPIFLDTSVLQAVFDHGEFIFDGVRPPPSARIMMMEGGPEEIDALQAIFSCAHRNALPMAISEHVVLEVDRRRGRHDYTLWAFDMLEWWESFQFKATSHIDLAGSAFGYLSAEDRVLIQDALRLGCRSFLTMEKKLPKNADHLRRRAGIDVMRPTRFWSMVAPSAALL